MVQVGPRAATSAAPASPQTQTAPPEEAPVDVEERSARRRRYSVEIPIDPEYLPYLGLMLLGLILRFWDLGAKGYHHDESLHAFYSWRLFHGEGYVHDPMMHGPLLFELNALAYLLFGASDFTGRLVPALFGVALIGMPYMLRHELGRIRRHRRRGAVHHLARVPVLLALHPPRHLRRRLHPADGDRRLPLPGDRPSQLVLRRVRRRRRCCSRPRKTSTSAASSPSCSSSAAGSCCEATRKLEFRARVRELDWRAWAKGLVVFLAINILLYTTFFTNLRGLCTAVVTLPIDGCPGSVGALSYWLDQQDFARGGQPWFYYYMLLPLYEFVPLILGVLAIFLVRGKNLFFWFCAFWFVAAMLIYSWAGEKMPWMLPQMTLPLVLLSGRLLGEWADAGWGRRALSPRGLATAGLIVLALFALLAWIGLGAAPVADASPAAAGAPAASGAQRADRRHRGRALLSRPTLGTSRWSCRASPWASSASSAPPICGPDCRSPTTIPTCRSSR